MTSSREKILRKLRAARTPFPDAPPRPKPYLPVTSLDDLSPEGLLARFTLEMERLQGQVFPVDSDDDAREKTVELLQSHDATHILAWHFTRIPVKKLRDAIEAAGITITQPDVQDEFRAETIESIRDAQVGLTGVDAAAASTATLIVTSGPGKGRIPTMLPPVHLVVMTLDQLVPRIEDWVAHERAHNLDSIRNAANVAFISGPSRTGDIEMELVLGVHGPGQVQVVLRR
ncbi:MAG: lactate utilization protein [Anaerolineaceae bacterium]|nr:lactate utilization protein [Anaerolineaceae bacterium]